MKNPIKLPETNYLMMRRRLSYKIISLILFQLITLNIHGQSVDIQLDKAKLWIDSVFESLSITDRINQLLVLEMDARTIPNAGLSGTLGGVIIHADGAAQFANAVNDIQNQLLYPAFVFAQVDKNLQLSINNMPSLVSSMTLSAIAEPHLLYQSGRAIASQSKRLGISALIVDSLVSNEETGLDWREKEFRQGIEDEGLLSPLAFHLTRFDSLHLQIAEAGDRPEMIIVDEQSMLKFHEKLQKSLADGELDLEHIYVKCRQILAMKYVAGLHAIKNVDLINIDHDLNNAKINLLRQELAAASITVVKNEMDLIPISNMESKKIASLSFGKWSNAVFEKNISQYISADHFAIDYDASYEKFAALWTTLTAYDLVITAMHQDDYLNSDSISTGGFSLFMRWLHESGKSIDTYVGDPLMLRKTQFLLDAPSLILAYDDNELTKSLMPQVIFGGREADGILPVSLSPAFPKGYGIHVSALGRFTYTFPEAVGLDSKRLDAIDSIVAMGIRARAIPGCQVLVAKDNQVVFQKSYGFQTYDSLRAVRNDDLYDLASLTKVSGALPCLMKLYEEGKFDLDAHLGTYLKYYKRGNKKEITFREILAHQAGLKAWIPYWQTAIRKNGKYRRKTLDDHQSDKYPYEISRGIYLHKDYKKKIYKQIKKSKVGDKKYLYSGITFFLFPDIIETISGENYVDYLYDNFYKPLGSSTLTYNPMEEFELDHIVPTEYDSLFRKTQIHGKVHDEGAAMMAGVSSNAGLFADANDLAKLFQMYCNYGVYGGRRYLQESTVREFARSQYPENDNRRGLGFDRPMPIPTANGNTAISASQQSFGHTGFTGTFAWADPKYNLVYIFLSNRVYPTRANTKLYDMNIRTNIQQVIYDAME